MRSKSSPRSAKPIPDSERDHLIPPPARLAEPIALCCPAVETAAPTQPDPALAAGRVGVAPLVDGDEWMGRGSLAAAPPLREILGRPELLLSLTPRQWDLVLRQ